MVRGPTRPSLIVSGRGVRTQWRRLESRLSSPPASQPGPHSTNQHYWGEHLNTLLCSGTHWEVVIIIKPGWAQHLFSGEVREPWYLYDICKIYYYFEYSELIKTLDSFFNVVPEDVRTFKGIHNIMCNRLMIRAPWIPWQSEWLRPSFWAKNNTKLRKLHTCMLQTTCTHHLYTKVDSLSLG